MALRDARHGVMHCGKPWDAEFCERAATFPIPWTLALGVLSCLSSAVRLSSACRYLTATGIAPQDCSRATLASSRWTRSSTSSILCPTMRPRSWLLTSSESRGWLFHKEFKVRSLLLLNHPLPISPALSIRGRDYVVGWNRPSVGDWVMHVLLLNSISHNAILQSAMLGSQHEKCGACASCDFDA